MENQTENKKKEADKVFYKAVEDVKKIGKLKAFILLAMSEEEDEDGNLKGMHAAFGKPSDLGQIYNSVDNRIKKAAAASCIADIIEILHKSTDEEKTKEG